MADEFRLQAPEIKDIGVNFPFLIALQHPILDLDGMFRLTKIFDLYEMERDSRSEPGLVKEQIIVDVLELTPTVTTIKITPSQTLPYEEIRGHIEVLLGNVAKRMFKTPFKVLRLTWEIDKTGVASDLRGMLRKVI